MAALLVAASTFVVGAPAVDAATFAAHGSVNQVYSTGHTPGVAVDLLDASDDVVATAHADSAGAMLFREIPAGSGYRVREGVELSSPLTVLAPDDHPDADFYDGITLNEGYN